MFGMRRKGRPRRRFRRECPRGSGNASRSRQGEQAMKNIRRSTLAVIFTLLLTSLVWAQQEEQPYPDPSSAQTQATDQNDRNDPPGRAARLQYMSGSVSVQPRGTEDWVAGTLNRPLTISDNVWTDKE